MNIAILNYHRLGGSGIVAYEIGRAMAEERGHSVHFIGLEPPFRLKDQMLERVTFHQVDLQEYPVFDHQPYALALASQLSEIILKYDIDVIHSHYALPHAVSAILAKEISGRPVTCVTTLHGTDITVVGSHPGMRNITEYAIRMSDVVTAVSNNLKNETEEKFSIPPGKIQTVYNFINTRDFYPAIPKLPTQCDGACMILHVSNLRPVKAPLDVIRIFAGILKLSDIDIRLCIFGEGPMQSEMMRLASELGVEDKVNFLGIFHHIASLMASSKLMLLPSKQESFGLAALESMACGVPVVASRVGGLPEVIDHGKDGLLFESGDLEGAVEHALRLLNDGDFYSRMSEAAVQTATHKFSRVKIIDQYEALYRSRHPDEVTPSNP
jgi:N-acetyl-alpha-D-glucosaminyl L-malate synthase BshA